MTKRKNSNPDAGILLIKSTDGKFMCRLIDWMNETTCEKDSTMIRVYDKDPEEEVESNEKEIDELKDRIHNLEEQIARQSKGN
jgi:hypothetical protein